MDSSSSPTRTLRPGIDADRGAMYHLLNSIIVPRPIAWISTCNADGRTNLAPHSYFTVASVAPPILAFTSIGAKDTVRNITDVGEYVINVVDHASAPAMNITSINAPSGVSEFELADLAEHPSDIVRPPRVASAPVAIECQLDRIIELGTDPAFLVLGAVVAVHIDERVIDERGRINEMRLDAIARMAGSLYCTSRDQFSMERPQWGE